MISQGERSRYVMQSSTNCFVLKQASTLFTASTDAGGSANAAAT
jgi:hypothetical protein